jgi:hypothetical protein
MFWFCFIFRLVQPRHVAMTKIKIYVLLSVLVILAQSAHGFQLPTNYSTELARYSVISTTSNCTDGGPDNCNDTCPTRTDFPTFKKTIESISSNCTVYNDSPPPHSNIDNGGIEFNSSTTDCPLHEKVYPEDNQHFTITMWVKVSTSMWVQNYVIVAFWRHFYYLILVCFGHICCCFHCDIIIWRKNTNQIFSGLSVILRIRSIMNENSL